MTAIAKASAGAVGVLAAAATVGALVMPAHGAGASVHGSAGHADAVAAAGGTAGNQGDGANGASGGEYPPQG